MRFLSLFSGIEAASVAWEPLGWECAAVAEIDDWPSHLLHTKYPHVPNLGDVTQITENDIAGLGHIDIVIFGSPCQDLSVAGKREGLAGERSGLFHDAMRIVGYARKHCDTRFALWENVFGAFSSNRGLDFAVVVATMGGCRDIAASIPQAAIKKDGAIRWGNEGAFVGPDALVEWSTLDAQWFGVAQRRRRVFALADFGDWADRPPILLESDRLRGNTAPRREAREGVARDVAPCLDASYGRPFGCSNNDANHGHGHLITEVAQCLTTKSTRFDPETQTLLPVVAHSLRAGGFDASEDGTGRGTPIVPVVAFSSKDYGGDAVSNLAPTLRAMNHGSSHMNGGGQLAIAQAVVVGSLSCNSGPNGHDAAIARPVLAFDSKESNTLCNVEVTPCLTTNGDVGKAGGRIAIATRYEVRRLTPRECERLQGFPDDHTLVPKKPIRLDVGISQCLKQTVFATVVAKTGERFIATNHIARTPAGGCPRALMPTGQGYHLCRDMCGQEMHAEVRVLKLAGKKAKGATLYLQGHSYLCDDCMQAAKRACIGKVVIGEPPPVECADSPRYKALGNSMAVPVIRWIGNSIERALDPFWAGYMGGQQ